MAKKVDIIDVMIAASRGELKIVIKNGFFLLEDTISGQRVRLNETDAATVVRCDKCIHWASHGNGYGKCRHPRFHIENEVDPTTEHNSFCDKGERRYGE